MPNPAARPTQEILPPEDLQPGEMTPRTVAALAREETERSIATLVEVRDHAQAPMAARALAANSLLDRGHGKPPQAVLIAEQRAQIDYRDPAVIRSLARKIAFIGGATAFLGEKE